MKNFWRGLEPRRRRGLLVALGLIAVAQTVGIPRLRAALRGRAATPVVGKRMVTMIEQRHNGLRSQAPMPVAGSLDLSTEVGEGGQPQVAVAYFDQWREEVARGLADVGADGTISLEVSHEHEAPRPWWRCRALQNPGCTAYAVEINTLRLTARLDADGVAVVDSLQASTRNLIRERAGSESHDDAERWTRHVLAEPVRIALDSSIP